MSKTCEILGGNSFNGKVILANWRMLSSPSNFALVQCAVWFEGVLVHFI